MSSSYREGWDRIFGGKHQGVTSTNEDAEEARPGGPWKKVVGEEGAPFFMWWDIRFETRRRDGLADPAHLKNLDPSRRGRA